MKSISMFLRSTFLSTLSLLILAAATAVAADAVRLHGAVSMEKLFAGQKQAIESQCGVTLELVGNGSGRGLADLSAGLADIAMIGGSLKAVAEATNKEKPGSVNPAGMQEVPLASLKIAVVTHPGLGLKSLTAAQLRDVYAGKVKSWKDVGGPDVPVKVVLPFAGDGARVSIQEALLKEVEFAKDAILRNSSKDICTVVTQLPGSCGFVTVKNISGEVATVSVDQELLMPMQLITKGEPAGGIKKVVDMAKTVIKP
jgi:phosphate transport system substrate-binding protein